MADSHFGASGVITWQAAVYALALGFICILLVPLTSLWWIVPLLGVAAPMMLASGRALLGRAELSASDVKIRELLQAAADRGELSAVEAAQATSCTVTEAARLLESLARQSRLIRHTRDGGVVYALPARDISPTTARLPAPPNDGASGAAAQLDEPLSDREREVLALLASGKTTSEAAHELFISVGTVKSHTANIYRKLGAKNRAEAVTRARDFGLLP